MTKHILKVKVEAMLVKQKAAEAALADLQDELEAAKDDIESLKENVVDKDEVDGTALNHLERALDLIEREVPSASVPLSKAWELKEEIRDFLGKI
jgi:hypothetical protein